MTILSATFTFSLVFSYSMNFAECCFRLLILTVPFSLSVLTSCGFEGTHPAKDKTSNKRSFLTKEASASTGFGVFFVTVWFLFPCEFEYSFPEEAVEFFRGFDGEQNWPVMGRWSPSEISPFGKCPIHFFIICLSLARVTVALEPLIEVAFTEEVNSGFPE